MNILELLKTVDELAKVIVQKNNELELLKEGYDSKIRQLNEYISVVRKGLDIKDYDDSRQTITGEELLQTVLKANVCSNCLHRMWNEDDFILVPLQKVRLLSGPEQKERHVERQPEQQKPEQQQPEQRQQHVYSHPHSQSKKSTSSKRICSYCKQLGHSRAKCPTKLGVVTTDI